MALPATSQMMALSMLPGPRRLKGGKSQMRLYDEGRGRRTFDRYMLVRVSRRTQGGDDDAHIPCQDMFGWRGCDVRLSRAYGGALWEGLVDRVCCRTDT